MFYVQVRRGGFKNPSSWGNKGSSFPTLQEAKEHIRSIEEMADKLNCVIDYLITDKDGKIVEEG